jgi:hypothetical protein
MIECPYRHPVDRKKMFRYEVQFRTVNCNSWFNREKKKTKIVLARSPYYVAAELEFWTWGDCFRITSITELGTADD